jgi:hypothetical protein
MRGDLYESCGSSNIDILNISIGMKTIGKVYRDFVFLYAGIGPNVGIVFINNKLNCCADCGDTVSDNNCKAGIGVIAKTGSQIFFTPHFYLDLFVDYLYLHVHFNRTANIGGFKVGGGIGAKF